MRNFAFLTLGITVMLLSSCLGDDVKQVQGLKPIYGDLNELKTLIKSTDPQSLSNPGKIYIKDNLLLINEVLKGVHVFDNADPTSPNKIGFISIPGNLDVAMKGNMLYADYQNGLVTIDISDINNAEVKDFNSDYNSLDNGQLYPPAGITAQINSSKVYFECPDAEQGVIIGWEKVSMPESNCYIQN